MLFSIPALFFPSIFCDALKRAIKNMASDAELKKTISEL